LSNVQFGSTGPLTHVRTRYDIQISATIDVADDGTTPLGPTWWWDLMPCYGIEFAVSSLGPFIDPFGVGTGETHSVASGGFEAVLYNTGVNPTTHNNTQTVVWSVRDQTEGMRKLEAGVEAACYIQLGFNYDSYVAGYADIGQVISFDGYVYAKTLVGGQSTIT
jgi:hypothetical protein